jgi:NADH-quinone oxidoreductase subunit A
MANVPDLKSEVHYLIWVQIPSRLPVLLKNIAKIFNSFYNKMTNTTQIFISHVFFAGLLAVLVALLLFSLSYLLITQSFSDVASNEKNTAYECGFNPFQDARVSFDIRFYIVGMLFLIFDIELIVIYTWCVVAGQLGFFGFLILLIFLFFLLIGFVYEIMLGALDFE